MKKLPTFVLVVVIWGTPSVFGQACITSYSSPDAKAFSSKVDPLARMFYERFVERARQHLVDQDLPASDLDQLKEDTAFILKEVYACVALRYLTERFEGLLLFAKARSQDRVDLLYLKLVTLDVPTHDAAIHDTATHDKTTESEE